MTQAKLRLTPDLLTPGDLKRARVALGGRSPWELLEDPLDAMILAIWCFRSRENPDFTFEDAENTPLGEFDMGGEVPPPIPGGGGNGASPGNATEPASPPTPTVSEAAPS
jgi:hypothetical protein